MAITLGCQCLFIFLTLVVIIAAIIPASLISFRYAKPLVDYPSTPSEYKDWAIVADSDRCATVAKDILIEKKGTIGDAAVAALACMAVLMPHRCGLGGGMMALYYDQAKREVSGLEALGVEPLMANASWYAVNWTLTSYGRMAPITPGALAGYAALHKRLGKLTWPTVLRPAIAMIEQNLKVGPRFAEAIRRNEKRLGYVYGRMFLKDTTGVYLRANQRLHRVLIDVSSKGWKALYTGKHAERIVDDLARDLGVLSLRDLALYEPRWIKALEFSMETGKVLHAFPIPGGGPLLGPILDTVKVADGKLRLRGVRGVPHTPTATLHRLLELLKFTYAKKGDLGDTVKSRQLIQPNFTLNVLRTFHKHFNPASPLANYSYYHAHSSIDYDDGGGAHVALRDQAGNALSVITSLNWEFGSSYMTSCGILMNNFMDCFSRENTTTKGLRQSKENDINALWKRPATTMTPVMITYAKSRKLFAVLGATGGIQGISVMAQFLQCISTFPVMDCAHNNVRVHVLPNDRRFSVMVGPKLETYDLAKELKALGHEIVEKPLTATLNAIVATSRNSWIAAADTNYTDGGSRGVQYVHPVVRNTVK